jgi:Lrp/AsnC family transcriptional regulator, leucine-responsive regulatory protein
MMDGFDRKILAIVQRDCLRKAEAIAEEVGLSASAVQRRLRALRASGVIRAEVAVVDAKAVGQAMTFIAGLEVDRDNYDVLQKLQLWADATPQIQQLYYVTGAVDLVAVILARDVEDFDALSARLMRDNPLIRRITTNVVLKPLKLGLYVLPEDP